MTNARIQPAGDTAAELDAAAFGRPAAGWRRELYVVIFESDTRAGLLFDQVLLVTILASVTVVMLDSVFSVSSRHHTLLAVLEWIFTALFTIEYVARLTCVERPWRYARSFYGIVDLASVLPTYLAFFLPELHVLMDVRVLRMLKVFRILAAKRRDAVFDRYSDFIGVDVRRQEQLAADFLFDRWPSHRISSRAAVPARLRERSLPATFIACIAWTDSCTRRSGARPPGSCLLVGRSAPGEGVTWN